MKFSNISLAALTGCLVLAAHPAFAADQLQAVVTGVTGPTPTIAYSASTVTGSGITVGTGGVVRVVYSVSGATVPCGDFSSISAALTDVAGNSNPAATYPQQFAFQQGDNGQSVRATASALSPTTGPGWSDTSTIGLSIDCTHVTNPTQSQVLSGHIDLSSTTSNGHLSSISGIEVHIVFTSGQSPCLTVTSVATDQDTGVPLTQLALVSKKGYVKATNPGEVSSDAIVYNNCGQTMNFDVVVGLPPSWQTNPNNNPGNGTFEYIQAGELVPSGISTLVTAVPNTGSPQGETLCLSNVALTTGDSLLMTVHSQIVNGTALTSITGNPATSTSFSYTGAIYPAGTACGVSPLPTPLMSSSYAVPWN